MPWIDFSHLSFLTTTRKEPKTATPLNKSERLMTETSASDVSIHFPVKRLLLFLKNIYVIWAHIYFVYIFCLYIWAQIMWYMYIYISTYKYINQMHYVHKYISINTFIYINMCIFSNFIEEQLTDIIYILKVYNVIIWYIHTW